jgi:hypothetical protein
MSIAIKSAIYGVCIALVMVTAGLLLVFKMGWYVLVPSKEFAALHASQAMLSQVSQWNQHKRTQLKAKAAKKATKRIAASATASVLPVVATVAATGATAYFLVEDHCDALAENFELDQMLIAGTEKFDTDRCLAEMEVEAKEWINEAKTEGKESFNELRRWISTLKFW